MKINLNTIINIKNKQDLDKFILNKPLYQNNYLFHYLIKLNNIDGLKLNKWEIYIETCEGLNGFNLAAQHQNTKILEYLIETYPEYIYNRNSNKNLFTVKLDATNFAPLMNKYPKLDWYKLLHNASPIHNQVIVYIIFNLNYKQLSSFLKVYKNKPSLNNPLLQSIIYSDLLTQDEKIKILDNYSETDLNVKLERNGHGLIITALQENYDKIVDYLLSRNIDLKYYTFIKSKSPLLLAIYYDIMNNKILFSPKIFNKIKTDTKYLKIFDHYLNNIAHSCLFARRNRNEQIDLTIPIIYCELEILKYFDNDIWNQLNIDKISPLELLIGLDYDIFSKIIIENNIAIDPDIIKKIQDENKVYYKKWLKLYKNQPIYIKPINDIIILNNKYIHHTLFRSTFIDTGIFIIYLHDKYKELFIPNMESYLIKNLTFDNTMPHIDNMMYKENIFPWIISYYSNTEYYIHPYLNNLINAQKQNNNNNKRFGMVYLSLAYDTIFHANVLIYDFKNLTIERFEPYGNSELIEHDVDDVLEEELTWSTGFSYLRPKDFLPFNGFQTLSDENNYLNLKRGDFGGFCLAWCLWYVESKLINQNISSDILVIKLIHKINSSEHKFNEYIRNYSSKINEHRIKFIKKIGIHENEISNEILYDHDEQKLVHHLIKKFTTLL